MSIYGHFPEREELHFLLQGGGSGYAVAVSSRPRRPPQRLWGRSATGFTIGADRKHLLLVARGVGLATLAPLALEANRLGKAPDGHPERKARRSLDDRSITCAVSAPRSSR